VFKPISLIITAAIICLSSYWFYNKMTTPQSETDTRVSNLPWQIIVTNPQILHVFDLDIGKTTLGQAVKILKSEYQLAWFENLDHNSQEQSISLEAYFLRVSLSGLRAKIILELDSTNLDIDYLKQHSGKPEILSSHDIKYPLDDLAQIMANRRIKSLTYVPKASVEPELINNRFGSAEKIIKLNDNTEFWLYPLKGLLLTINKKGKEAFQYVPVADFQRLKETVMQTLEQSTPK
jgi:hypothetical protein